MPKKQPDPEEILAKARQNADVGAAAAAAGVDPPATEPEQTEPEAAEQKDAQAPAEPAAEPTASAPTGEPSHTTPEEGKMSNDPFQALAEHYRQEDQRKAEEAEREANKRFVAKRMAEEAGLQVIEPQAQPEQSAASVPAEPAGNGTVFTAANQQPAAQAEPQQREDGTPHPDDANLRWDKQNQRWVSKELYEELARKQSKSWRDRLRG